jgi:uncharacterized Ntn-hydrolase superfamily protein
MGWKRKAFPSTSLRLARISQRVTAARPVEISALVLLSSVTVALVAVVAASLGTHAAAPPGRPLPLPELVSTFSIVAFDPETGDLGVAVQSKFFAVGPVVPFAAAGIGAIATQSQANTTFGPRGLELLGAGNRPRAVIDALLANDPYRALRQVAVVDASGRAANFTGDGCLVWAGGRSGENFSVQGNILAGSEVVDAMAATFEASTGDLATRMVAALAAGQQAGGDLRGRQSAALLVVREGGGHGGFNDRFIDLRVDDHQTPIGELQRLLDMRHAQLLGEEGVRAMDESGRASLGDRTALLERAIGAFSEATRLDPANGWHAMSLAAAQLAAGDLDAAVSSAVGALQTDPWIKTGILRGFGSLDLIEELLETDEFRRAWEKIQVRY